MCPPPEIFDWFSINWNNVGRNQQHYIQSATISDADTIDIANKMPRNGMNICSFYEENTSQITFAPIMKFGDTVLKTLHYFSCILLCDMLCMISPIIFESKNAIGSLINLQRKSDIRDMLTRVVM